jgi:hypothetical protein
VLIRFQLRTNKLPKTHTNNQQLYKGEARRNFGNLRWPGIPPEKPSKWCTSKMYSAKSMWSVSLYVHCALEWIYSRILYMIFLSYQAFNLLKIILRHEYSLNTEVIRNFRCFFIVFMSLFEQILIDIDSSFTMKWVVFFSDLTILKIL